MDVLIVSMQLHSRPGVPTKLDVAIEAPKTMKRADVAPTDGFSMVVDGHFKTHFDNEEAAHMAGSMLLEAFPCLQIKIYDANTKTRAALK